MGLEERLKAAASGMAAPADALDVRRRLRQVEHSRGARTCVEDLIGDQERQLAIEQAYQAGVESLARGDVREAVPQLMVAADQHLGDASVLLADALLSLGDYRSAQRWCAEASADGFDVAALERRREQLMWDSIVRKPPRFTRLPERHESGEQAEQRRQLLTLATAVTYGGTTFGTTETHSWPAPSSLTPARIGMTDVRQVEAATRALRSLGHQYGGASCHEAVLAQIGWAEQMADAECSDVVRDRMHRALADIHSLCGWSSLDIGRVDAARPHFARALELLRYKQDDELLTYVLWRVGGMYMHRDEPQEALKYFQLAQYVAERIGDSRLAAFVVAGEARAYGLLDAEEEALRVLSTLDDEIRRSSNDDNWRPSLLAVAGSAYAVLAREVDPRHAKAAIRLLTAALTGYTAESARSRSLVYTTLAGSHLADANVKSAAHMGGVALDVADTVSSEPVYREFVLLRTDADRFRHPATRQLSDRIAERLLRRAC